MARHSCRQRPTRSATAADATRCCRGPSGRAPGPPAHPVRHDGSADQRPCAYLARAAAACRRRGSLIGMPVVKINAIEVPAAAGPELEKRFAHRAHAVENSPGFPRLSASPARQRRRPVLRGDPVGIRRGISGVGERARHRGTRRTAGQPGGDRCVAAGIRGCVRRCRIWLAGVTRAGADVAQQH